MCRRQLTTALPLLCFAWILFGVVPTDEARQRLWPIHVMPSNYIPKTQSGSPPNPPCGIDPVPPYPRPDEPATIKSWSDTELARNWTPATCTGWTEVGFTSLVTTSARFRFIFGPEGLLQRFGAISRLAGLRYWSTTHKKWQTLILDAHALTAPDSGERRKDFSSDEMRENSNLYFEQVDNLTGRVVYRMHVSSVSADRVVVDVENVTTMRFRFIPLAHPGEMQSIYFLDRETEDVWRYYGITRMRKGANRLLTGNASSAVNRAAAFYRYLVGMPADQEPPAAR
jgi:hypothetical protein